MAQRKRSAGKPEAGPEILMLGYLCIKDAKDLPEMVDILDRFGLSGPDIARICNAAAGSIRNARLALKNKKRDENASKPNH